MAELWNVNIHYDGKLDGCIPRHAFSALDVGCGDGFLAARLSQRVPHVVAVDVDQPVLERARNRFPDRAVTWRHGDILALALVAFARPGWRHLPWALAAFVVRGVAIRCRGKWKHTAPTVWPPKDTVQQLRRHVRTELPGARMSLLLMGRVFIVWHAPAANGD
jgi:SAM-dependent methyltransferase